VSGTFLTAEQHAKVVDRLKAENERLTNALADADDQIKEQNAHIESLQNTVAQVTAENVLLGEYVDADRENQNTIKKLETENERLSAECNSLAHQLNQSNERGGKILAENERLKTLLQQVDAVYSKRNILKDAERGTNK